MDHPVLTTTPVNIPTPPNIRTLSVAGSIRSTLSAASIASSVGSIQFPEGIVDPVTERGLRHTPDTLIARKYKSQGFVSDLITILNDLRVEFWADAAVTPEDVKIHKVSGSLTNAVFFVSSPTLAIPTILLRIYGPSSGSLISRPKELHTLHILSSQYRIGPRVFGTFGNGRVEEYFNSTTLGPKDMADPQISRWIGTRMAELHSVDVKSIEDGSDESGKGWEIAAWKNTRNWLEPAQAVMALPGMNEEYAKEIDLPKFMEEWRRYRTFIAQMEENDVLLRSPRVFAHNDAQYGNLLRLASLHPTLPEHHQIVVVDFEYASPNSAAFDIANHFHEWTTDYNSADPYLIYPERYPSLAQRRNFFRAYINASPRYSSVDPEEYITALEQQVSMWSASSHGMWAVWALVQAREAVEGHADAADFDYLMYAKQHMMGFRREIAKLGV